MATRPRDGKLVVRPLTASRVDDVKAVTAGTWGASCWDLFPRFTDKQRREIGGPPREVLARLARRRRNAPGLVAYRGGEPVGFISLGPRTDFARVDRSRATPPVDDVPAWVIPCITVRRGHRGQGVAIAMIRAAVDYAAKRGAPVVEAYPRADGKRVHDDYAFYGTAEMFRKAGFRQARGVIAGLPSAWTPRITMRSVRTRAARQAPESDRGENARPEAPKDRSVPRPRPRGGSRPARAPRTGPRLGAAPAR